LIVSSFILPTVIFFNYSTTRDNNRHSALFQISWDHPTRTSHLKACSYHRARHHIHHPRFNYQIIFTMDAPLSSPSSKGPSKSQHSYFSSSSSAQSSGPTSAPHQTQQQPQALPQQQPQGQIPTDTTSPFLRDFNLVAEAAKRAQMACLMRDLEAVGI